MVAFLRFDKAVREFFSFFFLCWVGWLRLLGVG